MSDTVSSSAREVRAASTSVFVATIAALLAATVVLLFVDMFLASLDRRASETHAASEYAAGVALLAAGRPSDAGVRFGAAVAVDRRNVNYALALGEAMLAEGRTADAEATLRALLDHAENDGAVNLTMAHVMLRENRPADAKAYFHRAIFGQWGADSVVRRTQARFELIDVLAGRGEARELLAELLPLEATSPDSTALRLRLGHLFIAAGSPARAATMFREVLRRDPRDAIAYAGMGEAALALGNFRTARADLSEAVRLRPDDPDIARNFAVADTVLTLDPTARGIRMHERYLRSRGLLARTIAAIGPCVPHGMGTRADSAAAMLSAATPRGAEDSAAETLISLSSDLWAQKTVSCAPAASDKVLRLLQAHLVQ